MLYIFGANISGTLPSSWGSMTSMVDLQLHLNSMLSGSLPPEWSSMTIVFRLYIFGTNISGPLPSSWSNMASVVYLLLHLNVPARNVVPTSPALWSKHLRHATIVMGQHD
ncbi:GP46-like surface antigen, putative [Bodo saltans]|uniref:GP46-like surface antigen, putative n=1 Tax=Bodo saltans TaxID=75058 RepID=A0A0S4JDR2_BODSA|nr:GP46-like surface antigen, putative [Bodo saltans]|eukprot:CUG87565.1 GP46-like surface antigen, putative [Bodo saltans]